MPPVITQSALAQRLEISTATVSKCLSNDAAVSPQTRARVLELADELGYRPPRSGRTRRRKSKAGARKQSIGVLIRTGGEAGYQAHRLALLEGLSIAARQCDVRLTLDSLTRQDEQTVLDDPQRLPLLRGDRPDGLILWQAFADLRPAVDRLSLVVPCVSVNNHYQAGLRVDAVAPNHFDGIVTLVEHLHTLGHREIGLVGDLHQRVWGPQRTGAFLQAMLKLDLADDPPRRVDTGGEGGTAAALDRAERLTRGGVTAWVALASGIGHAMRDHLMRAGLNVPGRVSIVACGSGGSDTPEITSLRAPWREIGRHAIRRLLDRIRHPHEPGRRVLLDCELLIGQSTAPPPAHPDSSTPATPPDPFPSVSGAADSCPSFS